MDYELDKKRIFYVGLEISKHVENYVYDFCDVFKQVDDFNNIWSEFIIEPLTSEMNSKSDNKRKRVIKNIIDLYTKHGDELPSNQAEMVGKSLSNCGVSTLDVAWCCLCSTYSDETPNDNLSMSIDMVRYSSDLINWNDLGKQLLILLKNKLK